MRNKNDEHIVQRWHSLICSVMRDMNYCVGKKENIMNERKEE